MHGGDDTFRKAPGAFLRGEQPASQTLGQLADISSFQAPNHNEGQACNYARKDQYDLLREERSDCEDEKNQPAAH